LEPLEIYRSQSWATALYRSHLAERLGQLGYGIEATGRRGEWELAGYTRDQILEFSNHRQDIEQELQRHGLIGAAAAQNVAHSTAWPRIIAAKRSSNSNGASEPLRSVLTLVSSAPHRGPNLTLRNGRYRLARP